MIALKILAILIIWTALGFAPFLFIYAAGQRQEHARIKNASGSSANRKTKFGNHGGHIS